MSEIKNLKDQISAKIPKVFISILTIDGHVWSSLAMDMINWSHSHKFMPYLNFEVHNFPHDSARNSIISKFLATDCDYLCMIDDDIVPPTDAIEKLLDRNVDVIAPVCLAMTARNGVATPPYPVAYKIVGNHQEPVFGSGLQQVDIVTSSMILIKRSVFDKIKKPYYKFLYNEDGVMETGEDLCFSKSLHDAGVKQYVDFDIATRHIKEIDLLSVQMLLNRTVDGLYKINKIGDK